MEGTPFLAENNSDKEKERRRKEEAEQEESRAAKKPEAIGFLAVEPASEKEPELSPLEKAIAATRTPDPEAIEKKPDAEEEPVVVLPETEPPSDRVAEEDARRIVHEMVRAEQRADAEAAELREAEAAEDEPEQVEPVEAVRDSADDEPPAEVIEPEPASVIEPEPRPQAEAVVAEASGPEAAEATIEEDAADDEPAAEHIDTEAAAEAAAAVVAAEAAKAEAEARRQTKASAEKSADDDKEKPGRIRSFFSRGRDKAKEEAESGNEDEESSHEKTPAVEIAEAAAAVVAAEAAEAEAEAEAAKAKAKKKAAGPEFRFKEESEEEDPDEGEAPAAEAAEETETRRKPEAKPERIGQMLLNTEAVSEARRSRPSSEAAESSKAAEEKMRVESSPIEPVSGKRIDTLTRAELMKLGETIEINGSNLRHIYETHLIGERGLRRLAAEYLRGGDLGKALRREVMEHEMDFERDPVMRDLAPTAVSPIDGNNAALEKLLKEADVSLEDNGESAAVFKAQARHQAASHERSFQMRRLLDIGLTLIITTLILLIIIIYLVRG